MERRRDKRGWVRRWLANPVASLVLVVMLVGDSLTLPGRWNATAAGAQVVRTLDAISDRARATDYNLRGRPEVYVVRSDQGLRVIDPAVESWNELSAILQDGGPPVVQCLLADSVDRRGFWAWTREDHFRGVILAPLGGTWTELQLREARRATLDESNLSPASWDSIRRWSDVSAADKHTTRVLWGGFAHDLFALAVLAALLYSFAGWKAWFTARPWSRTARRRRRGLCMACGYDLRGIESGVCPECGRPSEPRA
ncbi:MAG: hypothetical protein IPJ41_01045 [Phycisphaerales bacterium]|nr:hypothetical protein [Phycisphaerales bacterium]